MKVASIINQTDVLNTLFFKLGFFDTHGFYFNQEGLDEFNGYYDEEGNYREADYEENVELNEQDYDQYDNIYFTAPTLEMIEAAGPGTTFAAELFSLPFAAKDAEVEKELKALNIVYEKIEFKRDETNKLTKVKITLKQKEMAKALLKQHGNNFLGRKLRVDFPNLVIKEHGGVPAPKEEEKKGKSAMPQVPEKKEELKPSAGKPTSAVNNNA